MTYFMLFISVLYLLAEIGFRAFAIDRMGSLDLLQSEIQYLEMVGRGFAAFGFSLFFINLSYIANKSSKLMIFVVYFSIFFFVQKAIFDNIHIFADEELEKKSYSLNLYKKVAFIDESLSSELPYLYADRDSVDFKTFTGMMPYIYSTSSRVVDVVSKNEDQLLKKIVDFKMGRNIEAQVDSFNNLRDSIVVPLYKIREKYLQFQPNSELHKEFVKFHFSAFGYYFLMTREEKFKDYSGYSLLEAGHEAFKTGIPEKMYIELSLKSRKKVQRYLATTIANMVRKRELDLSSLPEGRFLDRSFFPDVEFYFYHNLSESHPLKYMKKRYKYEERLESSITEYSRKLFGKEKVSDEEYNALLEIVKTGEFSLFYKNPLILDTIQEDNELLANRDLIELIFSKGYHLPYITEDNYIENYQDFFINDYLASLMELKYSKDNAVKAAMIPPIVILLSTVAIFLNFLSIVGSLLRKLNVNKKARLSVTSLFALFFIVYPFVPNVETQREKDYYSEIIPLLDIPVYKVIVTRWLTNTNQILNGNFGSYEQLASLYLSGMQLKFDIYLEPGDFEYIMLKNNVQEKKKEVQRKYPDLGFTITNWLT